MRTRALLTLAALVASALLLPLPAQAAARVSVSTAQGGSVLDAKYASTIRVSGRGFQSIKNGHGGIYVFFGIKVGGGYLYVPDSESKNNRGFQKFVAFPGSDTAGSANGGVIKANGTWSTTMVVPGATFKAVNRSGKAQTVNCLKSRCGVITIGAHGVKNRTNETFTPVKFGNLRGSTAPTTQPTPGVTDTGAVDDAETVTKSGKKAKPVKATLAVDQSTAVAGRVLSFNAVGLNPGDQVVASLDDGVAAVGPLTVGPHGQIAGVLQLPDSVAAGTHTLAITGGSTDAPSVNFPVSAATTQASATVESTSDTPWAAIASAGGALMLLLGAIVFSVTRIRSTRRKEAAHAV